MFHSRHARFRGDKVLTTSPINRNQPSRVRAGLHRRIRGTGRNRQRNLERLLRGRSSPVALTSGTCASRISMGH